MRPAVARRPDVLGPEHDDAAGRRRAARRHGRDPERVLHARETDPELERLLTVLEPWAADEDPDADDVRLVHWVRRDFEKSVRVPADLAADITRAKALGLQSWQEALAANDFSRFQSALELHLELRHRYIACFEGAAHPYDVLLDDYEPGLTTAELRPLLAELGDALVPLVAAAGDAEQPRNAGVFAGPFAVESQRAAVLEMLEAIGYDPDGGGWTRRCTRSPRASPRRTSGPRRSTTSRTSAWRCTPSCTSSGTASTRRRSTLRWPAPPWRSRSRSGSTSPRAACGRTSSGARGRSARWMLPQLRRHFPGAFDTIDATALYRAVNTVQPSLIRIEADETTYNLHILLRFELELAMIEGSLAVADLPAAWNEATERLLGLSVPTTPRACCRTPTGAAG